MVQTCCVVGCAANSQKNRGLRFFKVQRKTEEWTQQLVRIVSRSDRSFNLSRARICSRHFHLSCLSISDTDDPNALFDHKVKVELKEGSLPTLFLPKKSFPKKETVPRPLPNYHRQNETADDDNDDDNMLPVMPDLEIGPGLGENDDIPGWIRVPGMEGTSFLKLTNRKITHCVLVHDNVVIECSLENIPIEIPSTSVREATETMAGMVACPGIARQELQGMKGETFFRETHYVWRDKKMASLLRSKACLGVGPSPCSSCIKVERMLKKRRHRAKHVTSKPIHKKTPLAKLGKKKLIHALKCARKENRQKTTESIEVQQPVHDGLMAVMKDVPLDTMDPMLKIFWEDQLKNLGKPGSGRRWHPSVVRFALLLHAQSPAAYKTLRESGVLQLPGEATLRDYSNVLPPSQGFQEEVMQDIKKSVQKLDLKPTEKYVTVMFDEMKIQKDLVFSERTGNLVGYTHTLDQVATHVLVFMVCGIVYPLKFTLGHFGTVACSGAALYPLFWKAVHHIENTIGLKFGIALLSESEYNIGRPSS